MEAGIVGLPNVGKSSLFNAVTCTQAAQAANYPFCTIEPNEGMVSVPDDRLDRIAAYFKPQKIIPAQIKLVDIAGIVKGASEGEGLGNKFLSHIREVDAIVQVVRCFADPDVIHVAGKVDPVSDMEVIDTELMLADMQVLENTLPKIQRTAKSGDKDAKLRVEIIEKCLARLNAGQPIRGGEFDPAELKIIAQYGFMTAKPILYVANVDDTDVLGEGDLVKRVREFAEKRGADVVPVCAKFESELAELDPPDRKEMLESVGLKEPALSALARAVYHTLGQQSYFTAGEKEVRAWTVPVGATAPQGAGVIHTDFERGFIRAEVYALDDLEAHKSESAIRAAGKLRVEGKSYVMKDGDICHFLFNV
ncbi:redox-regulated ATPase YchF [Planctomyces sp. SH-PL14]|uniref:redox-regulated ATPase YchF n=1 Tax=Planctomyces sp. SH-PL14 TaxID=1632864 RepID=UPI00078D29DE|nr:redox-regulated ATPase YchF [Planctomyces sp. SH-PL14]AMV20922.1 Ribosome-binding ATPase YchF [Planctomyces sp. SH-PL14]